MILQKWVNDEHWFQMMDILSLLSLSENINLRTNVSLGNFWELGLDVVSECSEFLDID